MTAFILLPQIVASTLTERAISSWPWYVTRASGFMAVALLFATVLWGIGQITGLTYRFFEPLKAWLIHKALALALLAMIAIHVFTILIDKFIDFRLSEVFVPFVSQYSNGVPLFGIALSGIAMAAGIVSMYIVIVLVLSSLGWIDTKPKAWRLLHYLSYVAVALIFVHGIGVGTDLKKGWLRVVWYAVGVLVVVGILSRLMRAGTLKGKRHPKQTV